MFKKLSLRLRITLLSAVISIGIAGALTATSIWGADRIIFAQASTTSYSVLPLETPDGEIIQPGISVAKEPEAQVGLESPSPTQYADITFTTTKPVSYTHLVYIILRILSSDK